MFTLLVLLVDLIGSVHSFSARITAHADNQGRVLRSDDGGAFTEIYFEEDWQIPIIVDIEDVDLNTILRFEVEDLHVIGGFIATIDIDGDLYSTTNPITDGNYELISSSDGITDPLVYHSKGSSPWNINTEGIDDNAFWIWNDQIVNTMIFEFNFNNIITSTTTTASPTTREPTHAPTPAPTSCFNVIHDWEIDTLGNSAQFRYISPCDESNQFLKIKMNSLIEYDTDGNPTKNKVKSFANHNWYWDTDSDGSYTYGDIDYDAAINKYISTFNLGGNTVRFNLETILFYEDGRGFDENSLKWSAEINNWPFQNENNTLSLCIDLMTNKGKGNAEEDDNDNGTLFTWNSFEFRMENDAECVDNTNIGAESEINEQNQNHLQICIKFDYCNQINYDPFISYINIDDNNSESSNINITGVSVGVSVSVFICVALAALAIFYWRRNAKLVKNLSLVESGNYNNKYDTMVTSVE